MGQEINNLNGGMHHEISTGKLQSFLAQSGLVSLLVVSANKRFGRILPGRREQVKIIGLPRGQALLACFEFASVDRGYSRTFENYIPNAHTWDWERETT